MSCDDLIKDKYVNLFITTADYFTLLLETNFKDILKLISNENCLFKVNLEYNYYSVKSFFINFLFRNMFSLRKIVINIYKINVKIKVYLTFYTNFTCKHKKH